MTQPCDSQNSTAVAYHYGGIVTAKGSQSYIFICNKTVVYLTTDAAQGFVRTVPRIFWGAQESKVPVYPEIVLSA